MATGVVLFIISSQLTDTFFRYFVVIGCPSYIEYDTDVGLLLEKKKNVWFLREAAWSMLKILEKSVPIMEVS